MTNVKILTSIILCSISYCFAASSPRLDPRRSLFITDLSVVNSSQADQKWSFISVMDRLKTEQTTRGSFLTNWLRQWDEMTTINNQPVISLDSKALLRFWPLKNNQLDFSKSPLLLSAVVYRPDLFDRDRGGEFRLIYTGYDYVTQFPLQFTIIAEFIIPKALESWAKEKFVSLSSKPFGPAFNSVLDEMFDEFVTHEHLGQIRVNDFIMNEKWDLREFKLDQRELKMTTTEGTPELSMENSQELISLVWENRERILTADYILPQKFWGGMALMPAEDFMWFEKDPMDQDLRKAFSMMTCNGCHSGAVSARFVHLEPRDQSTEAVTSNFVDEQLPLRLRYLQSFSMRRKHPYPH